MIVSATGSDYKPVPAGSYVANCIRVIDLGTQTSNYKGTQTSKRKLLITWEVPDVQMEDKYGDPAPATISSQFTASLHQKAVLRLTLESWRGRTFTADELKGFDLANVLGKACLLSVVHNETDGGTFANVAAVVSLPKGMPAPQVHHPLVNFDLDNFEPKVFADLGEKLREKIGNSPEYKAATGQIEPSARQHAPEESFPMDDEIPF
jgi:hypothetical protein